MSEQLTETKVKGNGAAGGETSRSGPFFRPNCDMLEREDELLILADVPGAKGSQIEVKFEDGILAIYAPVEARQPENLEYADPGVWHRRFLSDLPGERGDRRRQDHGGMQRRGVDASPAKVGGRSGAEDRRKLMQSRQWRFLRRAGKLNGLTPLAYGLGAVLGGPAVAPCPRRRTGALRGGQREILLAEESNMMPCRGIRGATTAEANTGEAILKATREFLALMIRQNGIRPEDVVSAIFSTTTDLDAEFPALAARQLGWFDAALLCGHELDVPGSLRRCIRILLHWNTEKAANEVVHVYIKEAAHLRPDRSDLPPMDWRELEQWIAAQMDPRAKPIRK